MSHAFGNLIDHLDAHGKNLHKTMDHRALGSQKNSDMNSLNNNKSGTPSTVLGHPKNSS